MTNSSSFRRRMDDISARIPLALWDPGAAVIRAHLQRLAEMDIGVRLQAKVREKRLPLFWLTRVRGGSGFSMATLIRYYFTEYLSSYFAFDLCQESEHLLTLDDYFDWHTSNDLPDDPAILTDVMQEGLVYSYDMTSDVEGFYVSTPESKLTIAGVSLVRHDNELSCIVLAGEKPPNPPDVAIRAGASVPVRGRENIAPASDLEIKDRYLPGFPGFGRIILMARYDLIRGTYDVRYVNLDIGPSFWVLSDDQTTFTREIVRNERQSILAKSLEELNRYQELFSAATALIYLPVAFVASADRVNEARFTTELKVMEHEEPVQQAISELGEKEVIFERRVRCLAAGERQRKEDH
ncbi:MAG: hypothetical protein ABSH28_00550 [Acidobacteriota bacterium]